MARSERGTTGSGGAGTEGRTATSQRLAAPQRDPLQLRGVSLSIHNLLSTPVAVREWVNQFEPAGWKLAKDWQTIEGKPTTDPEHFVDLADGGIQVVAELNTGHIILGGNRPIGFPWLTIGKGG
jgi:hypothetical protein